MLCTRSRSIGWLTLVVMTWASVWCCCLQPASAAVHSAHAANARACCMEKVADPSKLPAEAPPCPIVQLRKTSLAAVPLTLPSFEPTLAALPVVVAAPLQMQANTLAVDFNRLANPPPPAPTLLALHTSLVW